MTGGPRRREVPEAGLPAVEFESGTFFTVIFKRKKAEAITKIFCAKFSENFSVKGKQLDRMLSGLKGRPRPVSMCLQKKEER